MNQPTTTLLYVASPPASAAFYERLLGQPPVEASPGFAMFTFAGGGALGLWASHDVQPAATPPGGCELGFTVDSADAVRDWHARWQQMGIVIAQAPTAMDFGTTFVGLDPDGHRLRVFAPT